MKRIYLSISKLNTSGFGKVNDHVQRTWLRFTPERGFIRSPLPRMSFQ